MDNFAISSITGIIVPSSRDMVLVGNRSHKESFYAAVKNRFVSERFEPNKDSSLIMALYRGLLKEAEVEIDTSGVVYLGNTSFMRKGMPVVQLCFGALAIKYPVNFRDNDEMKDLRFESPSKLLSVLSRDDFYESKMIEWINQARKIDFIK